MRKTSGIILLSCLLVTPPALAGNLTFDSGQTTWHSTQCNKPNPPASYMNASPETPGNDMNDMVAQHNAFVDAAQNYMNCISSEADRDQGLVNQAIAAGAQRAITDMKAEADSFGAPMRNR